MMVAAGGMPVEIVMRIVPASLSLVAVLITSTPAHAGEKAKPVAQAQRQQAVATKAASKGPLKPPGQKLPVGVSPMPRASTTAAEAAPVARPAPPIRAVTAAQAPRLKMYDLSRKPNPTPVPPAVQPGSPSIP